MEQSLNIAFIGAGSMAEAMISGLLSTKQLQPTQITVTNHSNNERLHNLRTQYGINITRNLSLLVEKSDVLILAIKPKDVAESIEEIKMYVQPRHLVISVLAGVSTTSIVSLFQQDIPVVRAMPNTSASISLSATAISKGEYATSEQLELSKELFETIGIVNIVPEEHLHAVTGLSGSGPAYVYYLVEAMEKAATKQGLAAAVANELIVQTLIGSAQMLRNSSKSPSILRKEVTSPGGTTEAGLEQLMKYEFQEALIQCIDRATNRSKELGEAIDEKIMSNQTPN
ncbi:pyrroline-5-carboxylate reductase [Priestia megaterium]|nr:pyrroline-5-carboxylate reductase [Priestia megaterium]